MFHQQELSITDLKTVPTVTFYHTLNWHAAGTATECCSFPIHLQMVARHETDGMK